MSLAFNAASHEYRWMDQIVPSVTQILKPFYDFSMVDPGVLEHKRRIGVAVHAAIQFDIEGDLDQQSIADEWRGYFRAWKAFVADTGLTDADIGAAEKPQYHKTYGFAGTPDIPLCLDKRWAVLDLKTAATAHPAWALQTAAYKELININTPKGLLKIEDRYTLRLKENGTYSLDQHKDANDWQTFLSLLTVHKWRIKHGC